MLRVLCRIRFHFNSLETVSQDPLSWQLSRPILQWVILFEGVGPAVADEFTLIAKVRRYGIFRLLKLYGDHERAVGSS